MDEVLHADDAELAQGALHQVVGGDGGAVASDLDKPTLVDQLAHRLEVGSSPGDVGFTDPEHVDGGLVQLDEHSVVDLPQPEQLEDLLHLGGHLVDATDAHDKGQLGVSGNIVVSLLASFTPQPDLIPLLILVLLGNFSARLKMSARLALRATLDLTASLALRALFSACLFLLFRIVSGTAGSLPSTAILASLVEVNQAIKAWSSVLSLPL